MNTTHIHLLLNHFPIVGTLIGSAILFWGIIRNETNVKVIACTTLVAMTFFAIVVYLTGDPAEHSIKKLAGISSKMIHEHEDAATFAMWAMSLTGIAALFALYFNLRKKSGAKRSFQVTFIVSFICFLAMARTGYLGGEIRHPETKSNFQRRRGYRDSKEGLDKEQ